MEDKELQLENGNYTRIVNKVLDELVKVSLLGVELSICIFVIRKTWGYNKTSDQISISQIEQGVKRSRPTVVKALKNLQLVNILQLVKVGSSKSQSSEWKFNKHYTKWTFNNKLVNTPELVKYNDPTSKEKLSQLVKTPKHTKDNTKEKQKKVILANKVRVGSKKKKVMKETKQEYFLQGSQWNFLIDAFAPVNPMYRDFYKIKTERTALDEMAKAIGYDKLLFTILNLEEATSKLYAPKITKPTELKRDLGKMIIFWKQEKNRITELKAKEKEKTNKTTKEINL